MVPRRTQQMTWGQEVPQGLKDEVEVSKNKIYGDWIKGLEPEYYRMCWYAVFDYASVLVLQCRAH